MQYVNQKTVLNLSDRLLTDSALRLMTYFSLFSSFKNPNITFLTFPSFLCQAYECRNTRGPFTLSYGPAKGTRKNKKLWCISNYGLRDHRCFSSVSFWKSTSSLSLPPSCLLQSESLRGTLHCPLVDVPNIHANIRDTRKCVWGQGCLKWEVPIYLRLKTHLLLIICMYDCHVCPMYSVCSQGAIRE